MEENSSKKIKTLTEIVSNLSNEIDEKNRETTLSSTNFFESPQTEEKSFQPAIFHKKINKLESEFYAPKAVETVFGDDILLERKIAQLKQEIEKINHKIKTESTFQNEEAVAPLNLQKKHLQNELDSVVKEYKKIPAVIKVKNKILYAFKYFVKCISQLNILGEKRVNSFDLNQPFWKKNIQKLNLINKEIDEILQTNTPYGEQEDRYERLSRSLNKALKLRNSINREI